MKSYFSYDSLKLSKIFKTGYFLKNKNTIIFLYGLFGTLFILTATSQHGPGIFSDSVSYLSTAKNFISGKGFMDWNDTFYTLWPPLFPTLIGIISLLGTTPLMAARYINAIAFGLIIFAAGRLIFRHLAKTTFSLPATLALFSIPLILSSIRVYSEPVFVLLVLLSVSQLAKYLKYKKPRYLYITGLFVSLACLQRYIGVTLVITGIICLILEKKKNIYTKIQNISIFSFITCSPLGIWALRNYLFTTSLTGGRGNYEIGKIIENIYYSLDLFSYWLIPYEVPTFIYNKITFLPKFIPSWFRISVLIIVIIFSILIYRIKDLNKKLSSLNNLELKVALIFIVTFIITMLAISPLLNFDWSSSTTNRFFAPVYPFFILFLYKAAESGHRHLKEKTLGSISTIILIVTILWSFYPIASASYTQVLLCYKHGQYASSISFQQSKIIEWFKSNRSKKIFTDANPKIIFYVSGIKTEKLPENDVNSFFEKVMDNKKIYLVLFKQEKKINKYLQAQNNKKITITNVIKFPKATVYEVLANNI